MFSPPSKPYAHYNPRLGVPCCPDFRPILSTRNIVTKLVVIAACRLHTISESMAHDTQLPGVSGGRGWQSIDSSLAFRLRDPPKMRHLLPDVIVTKATTCIHVCVRARSKHCARAASFQILYGHETKRPWYRKVGSYRP